MSERSELQGHGADFGAERRSAHWCLAEFESVDHLHDSMVHR
jgi:hypothetical protein